MKNTTKYILTVILGMISGILGGGLGLGSALLALPGFLILGLVPNAKTSIGTALIASPASWPAAYKYYKEGYSNLTLGVIYFISCFTFSFLGAKINLEINETIIKYLVSGIHFLIGLFFLYKAIYD